MANQDKDQSEPTSTQESQATTVDAKTGEIVDAPAVSLIAEAFKTDGVQRFAAGDAETIQASIVQRVMKAESLDDLFGQWEAKTIDKFEGEIVTIHDAEWGTYNSEQGQIPLARLQLSTRANPTAQEVIATAPNLTAFVFRAQQLDALPFSAKIVGNRTSRGYTALHFERVA
jgi:hypothetical protein